MNLKTFSQTSRRILIKGVEKKLLFWGFDAKGNVVEEPMALEGGYMLRGEVYDDPTVPTKWMALRQAIAKKGMDTVIEEAAYTWFNRIMAIRILSKNQYDRPQLEYEGDSQTPVILTRARRGQADFLVPVEKQRLQKVITDYSKEKEAFAILLTSYCEHHQLLKAIFGRMDDYTELLLPDDILEKEGFIHLLNTTDAISDEDYQKVELIGWLYQFYISEKKDEVFASFKKNKKAEAKDIPAATQIFTPNWIVKYMVQNTVGKLWLDLNPASGIKHQMKYLIADEAQVQKPIISEVAQLRLLDPAVGSGHILVEGFDLLYEMYHEEFYTPEEAVQSILANNLFGLDIDLRAVQLAKFAVLLKAAKRYPEVLQKGWMPQIYAMPEPNSFSRQEVLDFLGREGIAYEEVLTDTLQLMQEAQNLGSTMIIDPPEEAKNFIQKRLKELEQSNFQSLTEQLLIQKIKPFIAVIAILSQQYQAVAANPPYMGSGNMNGKLKDYLAKHYPDSKSDLFAVFMEVCGMKNPKGGLTGMINQHSWMFLSSYEKLREKIIRDYGIINMLHLGPRTFEELSGEVVQSTAFVIERGSEIQQGNYVRLVGYRSNQEKEKSFLSNISQHLNIPQSNFSKIPGCPIAYWVSDKIISLLEKEQELGQIAKPRKGLVTLDDKYFIKDWTEVSIKNIGFDFKNRREAKESMKKWIPVHKGGGFKKWYGNNQYCLNWYNDGKELKDHIIKSYKGGSYTKEIRSEEMYFKPCLTWSGISSGLPSFRYSSEGFIFSSSGPAAFPDIEMITYLTGFLNSKVSHKYLEVFSPTLSILSGHISKLPLIVTRKEQVDQKVELCISFCKSDWDSRETSWDFYISPLLNGSENLGASYQFWKEKVSKDFFQLHLNEEELNRIFIEIYGLENELTPEVPLTEITILQEELDEKKLQKLEELRKEGKDISVIKLPIKRDVVMKQLISYAIGVNMGRYRLDKPGLNIAHPDPTAEELSAYTHNGYAVEIDEDGIIPLMGTACTFADDAFQRVKYFLEVVWGTDTLTQNLNFLQECLDEDLESYLVKKFWADHCKTYKKKPIYWLFSSEKGAFQVLAYMHRMNAFTVEKIRSNYLIPHMNHLRSQIDRLEASKEDPRLLDRLQKNLSECESYDLLLKDVADRQIVFDLDDGVSRNYELFGEVVRKVK